MRDEALALVADEAEPTRKLNLLREYLQAFALRSLHESEAFKAIAFVGGPALRFLHGLPRFSGDLDFSLHDASTYEPERWLRKLRRELELAGFDATVTFNAKRVVHVGWVRVADLLSAAGVVARSQQKIAIKLEIDTRPPTGALVQRGVITRHLTFALRYYAIESLMAGKLYALIARPYAKGRDWFDLLWCRARRPPIDPNEKLLQSALDQTQGVGAVDAAGWRALLRGRLAELDVDVLIKDVGVFLERSQDRRLLERSLLEAALDD
jgi:predicted nucleotidyltransferase component of viral defense system